MVVRVPNEAKVILDATRSYLTSVGMSVAQFADNLLRPQLEASGAITDEYSPYSEVFLCQQAAYHQRVGRILRGVAPFHLGWKYPWLLSLPVPVQDVILAELVRAHNGFVSRRLSPLSRCSSGAVSCEAHLARIMDSLGEIVTRITPAADGVYSSDDGLPELDLLRNTMAVASSVLSVEIVSIEAVVSSCSDLDFFSDGTQAQPGFHREPGHQPHACLSPTHDHRKGMGARL